MDNIAEGQPLGGEGASTEGASAQPQITSLDSLSEFEFQGRKLTPDQLQEVFNGYKTLSERQKAYEGEEKFIKNLDADIEAVLENPSLAAQFKSTYPEKYHRVLDRVLSRMNPQAQNQSTLPKSFMDEFGQLKSGYEQLQKHLHQMAVESANAKLDATLPKLWEKFPMANEDQVLARAESFLSQGGKLTEQVWERLAKESHEAITKKADAFYKKQLGAQLEKGQMAKDVGPGGAAPGKAPVKVKTFADAEKAMIEHLKANGFS